MQEEEGGEILGPLEDCQGEAEGQHARQAGAQAGPGGEGACQHWYSETDCSGEGKEDQEGNGRDGDGGQEDVLLFLLWEEVWKKEVKGLAHGYVQQKNNNTSPI